jgi:hypothetical protein
MEGKPKAGMSMLSNEATTYVDGSMESHINKEKNYEYEKSRI